MSDTTTGTLPEVLSGLDEMASVSAVVRSHVTRSPLRPAVAVVGDPGDPATVRWWTYLDLDTHARAIAGWLAQQAPAGSRVLLLYPAGAEFVAALLGCLYAGMVAVPSSSPGRFQHDRRRVLNIVRDARVACILTAESELDVVRRWAVERNIQVPVLASDTAEIGHLATAHLHPADRSTLAVLQYTSGSTADPKGVMVTHGNILANGATSIRTLRIDTSTRFGIWIPNYHDMGLTGIILTLLVGTSIVLLSPSTFLRRPRTWLELIDRFRVHITAAPSFAYGMCCRRVTDEEIAHLDLSSWRYAINSSEPVDPAVLAEFTTRFAPVGFRPEAHTPAYGMAEATLLISVSVNQPPVIRRCDRAALAEHRIAPATGDSNHLDIVSCGEPRDVDVRIVEPGTSRPLPPGQVGEIWVRGANVAPGYWENPVATAETFDAHLDGAGGYLRTGDLGALVDGQLYVTGRIKDMIIVRGRNLYPHDIEQELRLHHDVLRDGPGAVFTVPADGRQDAHLVVTHELRRQLPDEEMAALVARIRETVSREFGVGSHAVILLRRGGVRRTTSGKVQRSAMRQLYLTGALTPLYALGHLPQPRDAALVVGDPG